MKPDEINILAELVKMVRDWGVPLIGGYFTLRIARLKYNKGEDASPSLPPPRRKRRK